MGRAAFLKEAESLLERSGAFEQVRLELELIGDVPPFAKRLKLLDSGLRSRVAFEVSGTGCGRAQVATAWVKLKAFKEAWVYGQAGRAGLPVAVTHPRRGEVDLAGARLLPTDIAEHVDGLWLAQDVRAGLPALHRQLQPEPMVKRDEIVRVVVTAPGLQVSTRGRAMQQGTLGEMVPVIVERAESSLLAIVVGKGEVHVED